MAAKRVVVVVAGHLVSPGVVEGGREKKGECVNDSLSRSLGWCNFIFNTSFVPRNDRKSEEHNVPNTRSRWFYSLLDDHCTRGARDEGCGTRDQSFPCFGSAKIGDRSHGIGVECVYRRETEGDGYLRVLMARMSSSDKATQVLSSLT